jgi:asparagine synthase (glutamine-hydrolysing)
VIRLHLAHDKGYAWQRRRCPLGLVHYKGNEWEIGRDLGVWLAEPGLTLQTLAERLALAPYNFAVVLEADDQLHAFVDALRTHPIFIAQRGSAVIVTDDPYATGAGLDTAIDEPLARAEFELAGYALGPKTLTSTITALQGGECARVTPGTTWSITRYRPPIHEEALTDSSPERGVPLLLETCDDIFGALCRGLGGRQIVLPLSSGVDSRIIATMLKRHGHANVLTFTYGRSDCWEIPTSRETAAKLGFPWHFVPYTRSRWRDWFASDLMAAYLPYASRHVSTPHVQDWPAVLELKRQGLVQPDAVFMPGHTAMLISNRLDRPILDRPAPERLDALAAALYRHHFVLQSAARAKADPGDVRRDIRSLLPDSVDGDNHRLLNAYFNFEAAERHSKMLMNSVRVYEFFGHHWALPLWDGRLVRLWARVPYQGRYAKRWFRELLVRTNLYGVFPPPAPSGLYARWRARVKEREITYRPLKWLRDSEERLLGYFHHHFDWYGIVSYAKYLRDMGHGGNFYSLMSRAYLRARRSEAVPDGRVRGEPRASAGRTV